MPRRLPEPAVLHQTTNGGTDPEPQRFRELLQELDAIVWEADARTFQFSFVSQGAEALLGYPVEQWLTEPGFWSKHLHPDDRERAVSFSLTAVREGRDHEFEHRMVAADGRVIWLRNIVHVSRGAKGRPSQLRGLMVNITERKQAETELQKVTASARCLLWHGTVREEDGDLKWTVRISDEAAAQRFLPLDVPEGQRYDYAWYYSKPPEDRERMAEVSNQALREGKRRYSQEFRCRTRDGKERWLYEDVHVEPQGKGRWRLVGVCTDITERKEAEENAIRLAGERVAREEAEASRAEVTSILERIADGFIGLDQEWRILYLNTEGARFLGESETRGGVIGRVLWEQCPGLLGSQDETDWRRAMTGQEPAEYDRFYPELSAWFTVRAYPSGNGLTLYLRNITEKRRVESLRSARFTVTHILSEASTLEEASPDILRSVSETLGWTYGGLWTVEVEDGAACLRCCDTWHSGGTKIERFAAVSRKTRIQHGAGLPGRAWKSGEAAWISDVVVDDNFPRAGAALKAGLRAAFGFPVIVQGEVLAVFEFFSNERREPDPDTLETATALGGQVGQFLARGLAVSSLSRSEARKNAVLQAALDAIITMDASGRVVEFNPAAEAIFRYRAQDAIGQEMAALIIPPALRDAHRKGLARYLKTGKGPVLGRRIEIIGWRSDGSEFPVELTITRIAVDGPPLFTGYLRDITDRVEMQDRLRTQSEELLLADERKNQFVATLAHELRTPLSAVTNALFILDNIQHTDDRAAKQIATASRQTRHLARLVEDLLDITRIVRGKVELRKEPVDLCRVASNAVQSTRPLIDSRGHDLQCDLPSSPVLVEADPMRLEQIVNNLLTNAARYTEQAGRVRLLLEASGGEAVLTVSDNGVGIAAEMLPRIFGMFTQADAPAARSHGGLGIGLALVKGLVEMHSGSIQARSDGPGRGSEFEVRLPLLEK